MCSGSDYVIIEANERPGLANHEPQPTAERFVDLLFPHSRAAQETTASRYMQDLPIDEAYLLDTLRRLLNTPSPTGMTDVLVGQVCDELESLDIPFELTRRGAIRATLKGVANAPQRALVGHLDTLGAMVKDIRPNGRLELVPIGTWSARFAEGARGTIFSEKTQYRGTILPLKASGHVYNEEVDTQPSAWTNLEMRIDARTASATETHELGIEVGDTVSIDAQPAFGPNGFINSRHLDDKAGVAAMFAAARAIRQAKLTLPIDCHLLLTLAEEVGVGASAVLHGDVAELVAVDNGTIAPGQHTSPYGVTVAMQDSSGPFDWHLTRSLIVLAREHSIDHCARRVSPLSIRRCRGDRGGERYPRGAGLLRPRREPRLGADA